MERILIIDPQSCVRNVLREKLEFEGYKAEVAGTLEEACEKYDINPFDVVICEDKLVGSHVASWNKGLFTDTSPIIISDSSSPHTAVFAIKHGAFDFVPKPIDMNYLLTAIRSIDKNSGQAKEKKEEHRHPDGTDPAGILDTSGYSDCCCARYNTWVENIIGNSQPISRVKSLINKVAPSDARVLITGPSGTGKEQVATWLHEKSGRCEGPFVQVNCAAIPSELIESELFGHEKGAFTSAIKQRIGKFEQAVGGTIFLDEIGDMCLSAQAKVLRALQEKKICRVGGEKYIDVDVRIVAATNKNLREEIRNGNFREDLYHRLSVIVINMPPLAERLDDIPLLVDYFINTICNDYGICLKEIDKDAVGRLMEMEWSGNIRELRNAIERLIILSGDTITIDDVDAYVTDAG